MNLSDITDIAASGLSAQRVRMAVTASNLANAETTQTEEGGPYQRRDPIFRSASAGPSSSSQRCASHSGSDPHPVR